ncbi:DinB/UmuC family translesion DNA polymerase [Streptomyces virginiae]|uniref:DinB/UmuC family translesion DNA polymerase n=1 Tax=Streptomyces virginiae TaxID=1961 RepID=UPI0022518F1F|nr:hypothetical protein [Streptomyces virginiae]MCX4721904.1 hypothetical protein [Streptomyces virginiae]MCX5276823.1 hypothetical protein [Streptomyces virginiae]
MPRAAAGRSAKAVRPAFATHPVALSPTEDYRLDHHTVVAITADQPPRPAGPGAVGVTRDRLRTRRQAARTITMTVTLADRSQVHRSRQLPGGPSAHTEDLRDTAYEMYRALGFQRARVRGIALRCEQLVDAASVAEQLSFDQGRERRLRAEKAIDLLNARLGSGTVGPAASYRQAG